MKSLARDMGAIAEGGFVGFLAAAKVNILVFCGGELDRRFVTLLVRTVAKRLVVALTAGAPIIGTPSFNFNHNGGIGVVAAH